MDFPKKLWIAALAFSILTEPSLEARGGGFASRGGNAGFAVRPSTGGRGSARGGFDAGGNRGRGSAARSRIWQDSIQRPLNSSGNQLYGPAFNPREGQVDLSSGRGYAPSRSELQQYLDNSGKSTEYSENKFTNMLKNSPETTRSVSNGERANAFQVKKDANLERGSMRTFDSGKYKQNTLVSRREKNVDRRHIDPTTKEMQENRKEIAGNIRQEIDKRFPNRNSWFNERFWDSHHYHGYYDYHYPYNWWSFGTWIGIATWLGWEEGNYPIYYGYGYGYPVQGFAKTSSSAQAPIVSYSGQSEQINQSKVLHIEDWMPLGVFALSPDEKSQTAPSMYLQLALSKQGVVAGTYYNAAIDKAYPIKGVVNKDTRQASWKLADTASAPIATAGLYNLTENESPVRIHFSDGSSQDWLLVRLKEPS